MSYREHFRYDQDDYASVQSWVHFETPESLYELDRVRSRDRYAEDDIKKLEALVADLKEYRLDLARRYSELATMTYTYKLYLVREKGWYDKKVTYTVRLARVFPDGKEIDEQKEVFSGADRKKAFELFADLKKSRPGIGTVEDTQKKQWEK